MADENASFANLSARLRREETAAIEHAKASALETGKEPFDLDAIEAAWPDNPYARHASRGVDVHARERQLAWEHLYYVVFPALRTNAAFVARMKGLALEGYFD